MGGRVDLGEWRFHQAIVGLIALEAIVFDSPPAALVAAGLAALAALGPRASPTAWLWRVFARPAPEGLPAGPFRAAYAVWAGLAAAGAGIAAAGSDLGWASVGAAAALAAVGAFSGWCAVCAAARRMGVSG